MRQLASLSMVPQNEGRDRRSSGNPDRSLTLTGMTESKTPRSGRRHFPKRQGGKAIPDAPAERLPEQAPNRSWRPDQPGQGGEGLSEGYGGSGGAGTGPSGPEEDGAEGSRSKRKG